MTTNKQLNDVLTFDPLATAERLTGDSYKDSPETMGIGFALMQANAAAKKAMLVDRGDTTGNDTLERYVSIIEAYGFEKCLELPFDGRDGERDIYFVYATRDGLLLSFDTFWNAKSINDAKVWYNWRYDDWSDVVKCISSGGGSRAHDGVWVGDHDAREALLFKMDRLKAKGKLLAPWVERPFLWLLHYMDTKTEGYDYSKINAGRIAMLPAWVQEMIDAPER